MKLLLFVFLFCFTAMAGVAQSIENVQASFADGLVTITYELKAEANAEFTVAIYSSHNGFSTPLKLVTGDVGNVKPGTGKRAVWDAKAELISYRGEISFRVKGTPLAAPLVLTKPTEGGNVKRGKTASIEWRGGQVGQMATLELLKENQPIQALGQVNNTGSYDWTVPKKLEKGKYSLRVSVGAQSVTSGVFSVKSKAPLIFILPVAAVGALVALIPKPNPTDEDLPGAPGPQ